MRKYAILFDATQPSDRGYVIIYQDEGEELWYIEAAGLSEAVATAAWRGFSQ